MNVEPVIAFVGERTGLMFAGDRHDDAAEAVRRAMAGAGMADPVRYLEALKRGEVDAGPLLDDLTIRETSFFRHPAQLQFFADVVVPELVRASSGFRVWCAGAASGEEAYTLAVLLDELGLADRGAVIGTDIAPDALAHARAGTYRKWSLRGLDPVRIGKWFTRGDGGQYVIDRGLAARVQFVEANLVDGPPPWPEGTIDVVFCRNVLIHLGPDGVRTAARRLYDALAPGGWLITGPCDPPVADLAPFDTILDRGGLVWRRPQVRVVPEIAEPAPPPAIAPEPAPVAPTSPPESAGVAARRIRELANRAGCSAGLDACDASLRDWPLDPALHVLRGWLSLAAGRREDAAGALRRALYLEPRDYAAHALLATIATRSGDLTYARRSWRNARDLAAARPADEVAANGDGATAGDICAAATAALVALGERA